MMKCCTFCSNEAEMIFSHPIHEIGSLCLHCYMKFHGSCGACNESFLPNETLPDVNYQIKAKFINMGDKNFIFCDRCYELIRKEFSQKFA